MNGNRHLINAAQAPGGEYSVLSQPFYDLVTFNNGDTAQKTLFLGASAAGSTPYRTNMDLAGQFPQGNTFECWGLSFSYEAGTSQADMENIMNRGYVIINKGNTLQQKVFLRKIGAGCGMSGFSVATDAEVINNGIPAVNNYFGFMYPIIFAPNEAVQVFIGFDSALTLGATVKGHFVLEGVLKKPVY